MSDDQTPKPTLQMIGAIPFVTPPGPAPGEDFVLAWYHKVSLKEAVEAERKGDTRKAQQIIAKLETAIGTTTAHVIEATRGRSFGLGPMPGRAEPVDAPVRLTTVGKAGRPRLAGPRYANDGDLKPTGPNERVALTRLAMIVGEAQVRSRRWGFLATDQGGFVAVGTDSKGKQTRVDLRPADDPLDLAHARGWMSIERHQAARAYEALFRRVLASMPTLKIASAPSDLAIGAVLPTEGGRVPRSGVLTEIDVKLHDLAKLLEQGKITEGEYNKAEKAHRRARIDWSRVPDKQIAAIFDAAADLHVSAAALELADPVVAEAAKDRRDGEMSVLRRIWQRTTPDQARELFGTCLAGNWPQWINQRIAGQFNTSWERKRILLEGALDAVISVLSESRRPRKAQVDPHPTSSHADHGQGGRAGPKVLEVLNFVDEDGAPFQPTSERGVPFSVERKVRAPNPD